MPEACTFRQPASRGLRANRRAPTQALRRQSSLDGGGAIRLRPVPNHFHESWQNASPIAGNGRPLRGQVSNLTEVPSAIPWNSLLRVSAGLQREPDERDLQRESDPVKQLGRQVVALLGRDGVLQVGWPDDHEERGSGNPSPSVLPPEPDGADELGYTTRVDQLGRKRKEVRNDRSESSRVDKRLIRSCWSQRIASCGIELRPSEQKWLDLDGSSNDSSNELEVQGVPLESGRPAPVRRDRAFARVDRHRPPQSCNEEHLALVFQAAQATDDLLHA